MLIGYARVSTDDQKLDLQQDALTRAGCERILADQQSGSKAERPGLQTALDYARKGDTLVVWRLDRLSRSLKDLIEMVTQLESRGIGLKSVFVKRKARHATAEKRVTRMNRKKK